MALTASPKAPRESDVMKTFPGNIPPLLRQPEQSCSSGRGSSGAIPNTLHSQRPPHGLPALLGPWAAQGTPCMHPPWQGHAPLLQRPLRLRWQSTAAVPAPAPGRERNTPLFLRAAAAQVPAAKRFSPPANVSIALEIASVLRGSEFLRSRFLSHLSPV